MAEVLLEYADAVTSEDGTQYLARACGAEMGNTWQGWIEFVPRGDGEPLRSARETTQPNRQDTVYWATGLTPVYLQGSLRRTLRPIVRSVAPPLEAPHFDGPAQPFVSPGSGTEAVLDPFSAYQKGEALLRSQLSALAAWHLLNIIRKYRLSHQDPADLDAQPPSQLVETIIAAVRPAAHGV